ncbi:MAG TPA: hypothetical protein VHB77_00120, partial [Planctomycetaceae bacterium]|nr:hypothetical protein [Planctomycetaceae bacterium]
MTRSLIRLLTDYGMIFVLLLLCAFFSVVTLSEQSPTGEAAARQVAKMLESRFGQSPRVLIVARNQADDALFANRLETTLANSQAKVLAVVKGEPQDARAALQKIAASGESLDAIACTRATAAWLVFSDLKTDFPALGDPQLVQPRTEKWPNFLK